MTVNREEEDEDEEDEFWRVALEYHGDAGALERDRSSDDDDDEDHDGDDHHAGDRRLPPSCSPAADAYEVRVPPFDPVLFRLAPLPMTAGAWSPLGARAWYGSALLSSLFLLSTPREGEDCDTLSTPLVKLRDLLDGLRRNSGSRIRALELGSGAVGLAGMTLWWILARHRAADDHDHDKKCRASSGDGADNDEIVLTDNVPEVLRQLEANVRSNSDRIRRAHPEKRLPKLTVRPLDWDDNLGAGDDADEEQLEGLDLIFGSELVYTTGTGMACADAVTGLLRRNPRALVLLVQTVDRDGWSDAFVRLLTKQRHFEVEESYLNDADVHEAAASLIRQQGTGTLDRFDCFGVCCVFTENSDVLHCHEGY